MRLGCNPGGAPVSPVCPRVRVWASGAGDNSQHVRAGAPAGAASVRGVPARLSTPLASTVPSPRLSPKCPGPAPCAPAQTDARPGVQERRAEPWGLPPNQSLRYLGQGAGRPAKPHLPAGSARPVPPAPPGSPTPQGALGATLPQSQAASLQLPIWPWLSFLGHVLCFAHFPGSLAFMIEREI